MQYTDDLQLQWTTNGEPGCLKALFGYFQPGRAFLWSLCDELFKSQFFQATSKDNSSTQCLQLCRTSHCVHLQGKAILGAARSGIFESCLSLYKYHDLLHQRSKQGAKEQKQRGKYTQAYTLFRFLSEHLRCEDWDICWAGYSQKIFEDCLTSLNVTPLSSETYSNTEDETASCADNFLLLPSGWYGQLLGTAK